eukprot:TRINITY_DN2703_c0_g1_i1.p1 TRINITY_DN2703_c0_g1~~TRINITY_DN2703_c0_g1_i1.p1  ORF type:complete len:457 (+),score=101.30 TRINITY_DN2703_c0_g1_i1:277-1647(+)
MDLIQSLQLSINQASHLLKQLSESLLLLQLNSPIAGAVDVDVAGAIDVDVDVGKSKNVNMKASSSSSSYSTAESSLIQRRYSMSTNQSHNNIEIQALSNRLLALSIDISKSNVSIIQSRIQAQIKRLLSTLMKLKIIIVPLPIEVNSDKSKTPKNVQEFIYGRVFLASGLSSSKFKEALMNVADDIELKRLRRRNFLFNSLRIFGSFCGIMGITVLLIWKLASGANGTESMEQSNTGICLPNTNMPLKCQELRFGEQIGSDYRPLLDYTFSSHYYNHLPNMTFSEATQLVDVHKSSYNEFKYVINEIGGGGLDFCTDLYLSMVCDYYFPPCDSKCSPIPFCMTQCYDVWSLCMPHLQPDDLSEFMPGGKLFDRMGMDLPPDLKALMLPPALFMASGCESEYALLDYPMDPDVKLDSSSECLDVKAYALMSQCGSIPIGVEDTVCYPETCDNCECLV